MQVSFECRDPAGRRLRGFAVSRVRQSLRRVARQREGFGT